MSTSEDSRLHHLRADIHFNTDLKGIPFQFRSTWGLFSPREIDEGSLLLLNYLKIRNTDNCFDLGCGYGPIGLYMAKQAPNGQTLMVDKDFMAIKYSNKNARINSINNAQAMLSNGFAHIDPNLRFDIIASNIPAKVGKEMMTLMLNDAMHHLKPEGKLYLVTINGLRQYMKKNLQQVFGNFKKLKQGKKYTVSYAQKISR